MFLFSLSLLESSPPALQMGMFHRLHHKNSMASQYLFGSLLPVTSFFLLVAYKYRISTEKSLSDAQCNSTSCCYSCNIPSFAAKIQVLSPRMFLYMVWLSPLCAFLSVHLYSPLFHLLSKLNRYSLIKCHLDKTWMWYYVYTTNDWFNIYAMNHWKV